MCIRDSYNLVPILNVYENIVLPVELDGDTADQRFMDNIVNMLGLDDKLNNMPNQLSGGQQQRVAIARALISKPAIVLADDCLLYTSHTGVNSLRMSLCGKDADFGVCSCPVAHAGEEVIVLAVLLHPYKSHGLIRKAPCRQHFECFTAVSYTHLDVYKRQASSSLR